MKTFLPLFLIAALAAGCAPLAKQVRPAAPPAAQAASAAEGEIAAAEEQKKALARLPHVELTPQLLHGLLLAEVAGQRGQLADAAELYLALATETRDPRIARRATEIGLHGRKPDIALQAARLWRETDPDSVAARQAMIGLLATLGQFDELQTLLPPLLAAEPQALPRNLLHMHRLFARGGDRQAIRAIIDSVTAPYLNLPEAHFARAQAAFEANELPAARISIRRALELRPSWEAAALLRAQLTEERSEALMALGLFVAANPQASEARLAYARMLAGEKRSAEARREFRILLEQGGTDPARSGDFLFAAAVLSLHLGESQEAERYLRRLVATSHAELDRARLILGQITADDKRRDEALQWLKAVGHGDHYLPARFAAAGLLRTAGRIVEAHAVLAAALPHHPDHPDLLYELALLDERLDRVAEMEVRLRRLIAIKPDHAHAHNALGYTFANRNIRLDEARKLIERALELAPDDPYILDSKGWVLFRQGYPQAALEVLMKAHGMRPDPEIAAHVGEVLWALGRKDEARQTWDKARKAHPDNETLVETIKRLSP